MLMICGCTRRSRLSILISSILYPVPEKMEKKTHLTVFNEDMLDSIWAKFCVQQFEQRKPCLQARISLA